MPTIAIRQNKPTISAHLVEKSGQILKIRYLNNEFNYFTNLKKKYILGGIKNKNLFDLLKYKSSVLVYVCINNLSRCRQ